jgi:hypothetical protein
MKDKGRDGGERMSEAGEGRRRIGGGEEGHREMKGKTLALTIIFSTMNKEKSLMYLF